MRINPPFLLAAAAAFGSPVVAHALTGNVAEVHLDASIMTALLKGKLATVQPCRQAVPCQNPGGGQTCYIDHIELAGASQWTRPAEGVTVNVDDTVSVLTSPVRLLQPVQIYTRTEACIQDPDCPTNQYDRVLQFAAYVDLTTDGSQVCGAVTGTFPPLPPAMISAVSGAACAPLDLGSLDGLLGDDFDPAGVGISYDSGADRLGVRFEFVRSNLTAAQIAAKSGWRTTEWSTFLGGQLAPDTNQGEFSVFLSDTLFEDIMRRRFASSLADNDKLSLLGAVHANWVHWMGPAGALQVSFEGDLDIDECPNTIGVDPVSIQMGLSFNDAEDALDISGEISWDLVDSDVLLCGLAYGGFISPFVPITTMIASIVASSTSPEEDDLAVPGDCHTTSSTTFACRYPVNLPDIMLQVGILTRLRLDGAIALPGGLSLYGHTVSTIAAGTPHLALGGDAITYGLHGGCNSMHAGYEGAVRATGVGNICHVEISDDPRGVYDLRDTTAENWLPENWDVLFPRIGSAQSCPADRFGSTACAPGEATQLETFFANPYPMLVTVWATGGARTVRLPAPPPLTPEMQQAVLMEKLKAFAICNAPQTGWMGIPGMYDPNWDIDPPPYDIVMNDWRGRSVVIGQATLHDVAVMPSAPLTRADGVVRTENVALALTGSVAVDLGRSGQFSVPLAASLNSGLIAERFADGTFAGLTLAREASTQVSLGAGLPAAFAGAAFSLVLQPGDLALRDGIDAGAVLR